MDMAFYLRQFQQAADLLEKKRFAKKQLDIAVGTFQQDCVFLKLYKKSWASPSQDVLTAESRIFFSVWLTEATIQQQKILYNIHAFKLRKLQGYAIESRKFADAFRNAFKPYEQQWQNISTKFGPLTLMQGFEKMDENTLQQRIIQLSYKFLSIEHLVDDTLALFIQSK